MFTCGPSSTGGNPQHIRCVSWGVERHRLHRPECRAAFTFFCGILVAQPDSTISCGIDHRKPPSVYGVYNYSLYPLSFGDDVWFIFDGLPHWSYHGVRPESMGWFLPDRASQWQAHDHEITSTAHSRCSVGISWTCTMTWCCQNWKSKAATEFAVS